MCPTKSTSYSEPINMYCLCKNTVDVNEASVSQQC